jgi:hypothetical protein
MRARDVVDVTADLLRRDPHVLLCDRSECDACAQARRIIVATRQAAGESRGQE